MSTSNNHNPHVTDEQLDRHADALRNDAVPQDGPSPQALDATLKMLRAESSSRHSIVNPGRRSFIGRMVAMSTTQRIAATVLITLGGLTLYLMFSLFNSLGTSVAFADVVGKLKAARTIQYTSSVTLPGKPAVSLRTLVAEPDRMRTEMPNGTVSIMVNHTSLLLDPTSKTATRTTMKGFHVPEHATDVSIVDALRSLGGKKGEPLGEKVVDGVPCVGFRSELAGRAMVIWANKKNANPVRVEMATHSGGAEVTMVMSDFLIDEPLEDALFSLDPPAGSGYKLQEREFAIPKLGEIAEEVAAVLKAYAEHSDGAFPASLFDWGDFIQKMSKDGKLDEQLVARVGGISGTLFSRPDSFGYAGKGVRRGEKDKMVFWYRPEKSETYRAVFGDLRIEDVTADKLPTTKPVTKPAQ